MSRCDFGGMIILPAKITSSQFDYLSAEAPDRGLYLYPQDYVSLGIPAKIYNWIFSWWAEKILMAEAFSDS
jgi:hypothetical protein